MIKSSIHIKKADIYFILHSVRANKSHSVVFTDEENEYLYNKENALKIYRNELKRRELAYTKRTGKKLPKNTITLMSAIVNLKKEHNLENVKKIANHLKETLDTEIISIAIHRDEGKLVDKETGEEYYSGQDFILNPNDKKLYWVDRNKNLLEPIDLEKFDIVKNYHAHIEFLGLDSNGNAIKRNKLTKWYLSNLQTFVANTLKMERGYNYYLKSEKAPKRLDVREFKKAGVYKREGAKVVLTRVKDLKEEKKKIIEFLKSLGIAKKEDYDNLHKFTEELKERIKKKEVSVQQIKEELERVKQQLEKEIQEKQKIKEDLDENTGYLDFYIKNSNCLNKEIKKLELENKELNELNVNLLDNLVDEYREVERLKKEKEKLEQELLEKKKREEELEELLKKKKEDEELIFSVVTMLKIEFMYNYKFNINDNYTSVLQELQKRKKIKKFEVLKDKENRVKTIKLQTPRSKIIDKFTKIEISFLHLKDSFRREEIMRNEINKVLDFILVTRNWDLTKVGVSGSKLLVKITQEEIAKRIGGGGGKPQIKY